MQNKEGEIVIAGNAKSANEVMWILKIDETGKKLWSQVYDNYPVIVPQSIIETPNKTMVIAGYNAENDTMPRNMWVAKLDSLGKILWEKSYDGHGESRAKKIIRTQDNGFAIAGYTAKGIHEDYDWWIVKLDSIGNLQWNNILGSNKDDRALGITELPDQSLMAVGYVAYSNGAYRKIALSKYDTNGGNTAYNEFIFTNWDEPSSIITTHDGSIVVSGYSRFSPLIDFDAFIMKTNTDGDSIWFTPFLSEKWEYTSNVVQTYDKGYALGVTSRTGKELGNNFLLLKFDVDGKLVWQDKFRRKSNDFVTEITETNDNGIVLVGSTSSFGNAMDYAVLKYNSKDRSELIFVNINQPTISVTQDSIFIKTFIQGYKVPKEVRIFINDQYITTETNFSSAPSPDYDFIFNYNAKLKLGENTVKFIVKDYKDYEFEREIKIYYIPPPPRRW